MAQFIVRNLEDDIRDRLRVLAQKHGRSVEEEIREILRGAVVGNGSRRARLGSRLAERFDGVGLPDPIPELRGHQIEPPRLDR